MMRLHRCLIPSLAILAAIGLANSTFGSIVFTDPFTSLSSNWAVVSDSDGTAEIITIDSGPALQLRRTAAGRTFIHTSTSLFSSPYEPVLDSNPGIITWSFNMQQPSASPSGFDSLGNGVAFVLAASDSNFLDGNGYAVVLGSADSNNRIRLVQYSGGLDANINLGNIIVSSSADDAGGSFFSIKVTYDPLTNWWELFIRNDGLTSFADPYAMAMNSSTFRGENSNSVFTGVSLEHLGALWNGGSANSLLQSARFDSFTVEVERATAVVPEASTLFTFGGLLGLYGLVALSRRQSA